MPETSSCANTADGTHRVQAAFAMMLKVFMPGRRFSYERPDEPTKNPRAEGPGGSRVVAEFKKNGLPDQKH